MITNNYKIDKRHNYKLVLDVETANDLEDALVYDCGFAVIDTMGRVYKTASFAIKDIFTDRQDLMETAYYAEKVPSYFEEIENGEREEITFALLKYIVREIMKKYNITEVYAHNAHFDLNALNKTERYLTKSKWRYFFPYGTVICDSLKMARKIFSEDEDYIDFCQTYGFMTNHKTPRCRLTAEALYAYLTNNPYFEEEHKGLADVMIEKEIVTYCYHKCSEEDRRLFNN